MRPAQMDEEEEGMLVSEEEAKEGEVFVPRVKLQAYMMNEGPNLRTKRNEGKKFTKATDPRNKDVVNFMADENINCPYYLPMNFDDAKVTNVVIESAIANPHIPMSEHIRKENFYKFFQGFNQAIQADPALIKTEIMHKYQEYSQLYGKHPTYKTQESRPMKFT